MRRWAVGGALICFLLAVGLLGAGWYLNLRLERQGIEQWSLDVESVGANQLVLSSLSFVKHDAKGQPQLQAAGRARLQWSWSGLYPQLERLWIDGLDAAWLSTLPAEDDEAFLAGAVLNPESWSLPDWLPRNLSFTQARVRLPCPSGRCLLEGRADFERTSAGGANLSLSLRRGDHSLSARVDVRALGSGRGLTARVLADEAVLLELGSEALARSDAAIVWRGSAHLAGIPTEPWLVDWLREWQPRPLEAQKWQGLDAIRFDARWDLELPRVFDRTGWRQIATGELFLSARVPEAVSLPWVGTVKGAADLDFKLGAGRIERYRLQGDIQADRLPSFDSLRIPAGLDPGPLRIRIQSEGLAAAETLTQAPVKFVIDSHGELQGRAEGRAMIPVGLPWVVESVSAEISLASARVQLTETMVLDKATAFLSVRGAVDRQGYRFEFLNDSWIKSQSFHHPALRLEQAEARADGFVVEKKPEGAHFQGQLKIAAARLHQAVLIPQPWSWQGSLDYLAGRLLLKGSARAESGLILIHELQRAPDQPLRLDWHAVDLFLLAGNPLSKTFAHWPELAELTGGRVTAQGWLVNPPGEDTGSRMEIRMGLKDVSGLYDRSLFEGLAGDLNFNREGDYWIIGSDSLSARRINHGVEIGPAHFAGTYAAPVSRFADGMVNIARLEAEVLGGRIWVEPVHFNLSEQDVALPLLIRGIDLAKVLKLYRSADLAGYGTVDGMLPLRISKQGVSVAAGNLQARPPGGLLQYRPERAQALAQSDARMKLIVDVMDNFHYSVLSSDVSYAENGKLTLGVMLQGRNPAMTDSPPVNLNINLEENLPMLLASLQLADNVSDKIKKRVSEALENRARKQSE